MNWITNYVRPTINSLFSRREVPDNLWTKCPECGTMLFHRELADNLNVCTNCDHHMAIGARDRLTSIFDGGIFVEVAVPEPTADPLHSRDQKRYTDRIKEARKKTGERDAMLVAEGEMGRTGVVVAVQDFSFMGGSMGMAVGNALIAAAEAAAPLLLELGFPEAKLAAVQHAITAHSFSANITPETEEAQILQDADRLDALGAIGIARMFAISGALGRAIYDPDDPLAEHRPLDDTRFAVDHFETKLFKLPETMNTEKGRALAQARREEMRQFRIALLAGAVN